MRVPRHLQVPLNIDTSISYELDTSMFPGLDDPRYKHEPVLLIAAEPAKSYSRIDTQHTETLMSKGGRKSFISAKTASLTEHPQACNKGLFDDLLGIMDIKTNDLLKGIKNTEDYLSLIDDVVKELPHSDELQYLDGPKGGDIKTINVKQQSRECFSDRMCVSRGVIENPAVPHGYNVPYQALLSTINCTDSSNGAHQSTLCNNHTKYPGSSGNYGYKGSINRSNDVHAPSVNNSIFRKRKRTDSSFGESIQKKACFGSEFVNYVSHYQAGRTNCGAGFTGIRQGHQIRVM